MRSLTKPNPEFTYDAAVQIAALIAHRDRVHADPADSRQIPDVGQAGHVLIATWNIANFGQHKRRDIDIAVIAEIISWFEIIAIQEVADNLIDFEKLMAVLPNHFSYIFNDKAGNGERAAYVFDTRRVRLGAKMGEVGVVESDRDNITFDDGDGLPNVAFQGYNRNPLLCSFEIENHRLLMANCHLLYGPQDTAQNRALSLKQRQLEAYAISRWCDLRRKSKNAWTKNIMAVGDFNLPHANDGDPIFEALLDRGLRLPQHETRIPTNVSDSHDYDQIAVTPGLVQQTVDTGVFDFDAVVFGEIWDANATSYWRTCAKYYVSDHRPLWMLLKF
ncbi:hypothetical protein BFP76_08315 [Amylibacter kogurei]|uniref:Endonuclease/exonuclease/phosphatase domain-containing protein n=1 Tax=Paramylibacter kogurei TaxID=1889778 RepID=A0A2G5K3C8_9RHOB|nr:endonuclease/exonuclease/phosphatase family protein [Amylibacter kogurei]PIB23532.1 hypothetical protein BFP76_08315 [Amylibacter kogurei]